MAWRHGLASLYRGDVQGLAGFCSGARQREWFKTKYDGIFVVDGFATILFEVWKATHMKCLAVVLGGASFGKGSYFHMLAAIRANLARPRFMVWTSMANDLYPLDGVHPRMSFQYEEPVFCSILEGPVPPASQFRP